EEMFAKLKAGARGYDIIVGSDYLMPRLKALGAIDEYPSGALKNRDNVDAKFRRPAYDRDERLSVPYLWGMIGIGYNKKKLAKAPTSWRDLWDQRFAGRITMLDNARACVSLGLLLCGHPEDTKDAKAFDEVKALYAKQRPLV